METCRHSRYNGKEGLCSFCAPTPPAKNSRKYVKKWKEQREYKGHSWQATLCLLECGHTINYAIFEAIGETYECSECPQEPKKNLVPV